MEYKEKKLTRRLIQEATRLQGRLILPESLDDRVIEAAFRLLTEDAMASITLVTSEAEGLKKAKSMGIPLERFKERLVWAHDQYPQLAAQSAQFWQESLAARGKKVSEAALTQYGASPLGQAGELLRQGLADGVVAGCVYTTADVIRSALRSVGTAPGVRHVSGAFLMNREFPGLADKTYLFADCGVIIDPNVEQLADIATASVASWQRLMPQHEPVVAFLSFSTKGSADHPAAAKMAAALALFRQKCPGVEADGEMQFDAAFDADIGRRKCPDSMVPGRANIFIFPDLGAGNIAYKLAQRLGHFDAYGPLLQGTAKPFSDLSRGATASDIVVASCITMIRASAVLL